MSKQALTISAILAGSNPPAPSTTRRYKLHINPSELSHERTICYDKSRPNGAPNVAPRFKAVGADTLSFSVVFDGTGLVPAVNGQKQEVASQIEALSRIIYDYDGEAHEPNHVQIGWGTLIFNGRLESISTTYSLFKPNGAPLRARSVLVFAGASSNTEANVRANRSSPDLSHLVLVTAGDTLPLLCQRIYGDSRYYPEVAAFNGLREFRRLAPGTRLHFPPLR